MCVRPTQMLHEALDEGSQPLRLPFEVCDYVAEIQLNKHAVAFGGARGGAGAVGEDRHPAAVSARLDRGQEDLTAISFLHDLQPAGIHDVDPIALVALPKEDF